MNKNFEKLFGNNSVVVSTVTSAIKTPAYLSGGLCNVSFYEGHEEELHNVIQRCNNSKTLDELCDVYTDYIKIGMSENADLFSIFGAIKCNRGTNHRLGFDIEKWLLEDEEPIKQEVVEKKQESFKEQKSTDKSEKKSESVKDVKPVVASEKKQNNVVSKTIDNSKNPVKVPHASKLGFDINNFISKPPVQQQIPGQQMPMVHPQNLNKQPVQQQPVISVEDINQKVKRLSKNINLIKGAHPGFEESQVDSLLNLLDNKILTKKLGELGAKSKEIYLTEVDRMQYDASNNYDICFTAECKDKRSIIVVLYNTRSKYVPEINAYTNNLKIFKTSKNN